MTNIIDDYDSVKTFDYYDEHSENETKTENTCFNKWLDDFGWI